MLTLYTVLLTVHILLVVAWLGFGVAQSVYGLRVQRAGATERAWFAEQLAWAGAKWFPAVSGLTLLSGIALWIDGPWSLGEAWIIVAVVGWLATTAVGAGRIAPCVERWRATGAAKDATWDQLWTLLRVDLVILTVVVVDMVIKPG